jgi:hypothetical protein
MKAAFIHPDDIHSLAGEIERAFSGERKGFLFQNLSAEVWTSAWLLSNQTELDCARICMEAALQVNVNLAGRTINVKSEIGLLLQRAFLVRPSKRRRLHELEDEWDSVVSINGFLQYFLSGLARTVKNIQDEQAASAAA